MLRYRPRRWLVHFALAFGAGVYLGFRVPFHPLWLIGLALGGAWLLLLWRRNLSVYLPCMILAVLMGMLRCMPAAQPVLPPEGSCAVTATVDGEPTVRESDGRVAVYLKYVELPGVSGRNRAYWTYWPQTPDEPLPVDGQQVSFTGNVYHPMPQRNPHGFDFRLYLLQKGVSLGISGCDGVKLTPGGQRMPASLLIRARQAIRARLEALLSDQAPLAEALLLNDKSDLPEDVAESFRTAGVAHVLAVSGLHVMILFGFITLALRRLSPSQRTVLAAGFVLLGIYSLLAGAQAAALRAGLLMIYLQLGRITRRHADRLTALALAALMILLLRPLELFAAGFQMSFGAVLGITLLGDRVNQALRRVRQPRLKTLLNAYGITVCASLGVALPVGWYYHRLSLIGLVINPAIGAAVTLLLPLLILLLALSLLSLPFACFLGRGLALLMRGLIGCIQGVARLPLADIAVPRLPAYVMAALILAAVLCTRYVLLPARRRVVLGGGALVFSVLLMLLFSPRGVRYIQFSVGSADASVILDGRQTAVIDTGENGTDLAGYLLAEGRKADLVILSHLHTDHALGLGDLLKNRVPIGVVYLSTEAEVTGVSPAAMTVLEQVRSAGIPIRTLSAGDRLTMERVTIGVLWPEAGGANPLADANDFALAMEIDLNGVRLLQMSDVSGAYEMYAARPAQVLKVAHHGSGSSTGSRFLQAVSPQIALLSTRRANAHTLERLAEAGVMVYDTNERGALTLTVRGGAAYIQGFIQ